MANAGAIAANELTELTECSICMSEFPDPRMLPCIHTFCLECLTRTGETDQKKPGDTMPCPLCRKEFIIPENGIRGLQKNFFVGNLVRLNTTLQTEKFNINCDMNDAKNENLKGRMPAATMRCSESEAKYGDSCLRVPQLQKLSMDSQLAINRRAFVAESERTSSVKYCTRHTQKPLDYYCTDCKKIVCVSCFVESHKSHDCKDVATVEEEFRQAFGKKAWKVSNCSDEMLAIRKIMEKRKTDFLDEISNNENKIWERNLKLNEMIDLGTKSLLDELSAIKSNHLKEIEMELEEIHRRCTILRNFESYCSELETKGSASDICCSFEKLILRADDLKRTHETFLRSTRRSVTVSVKTMDFNSCSVGRLEAETETTSWSENCAIVVGLYDGSAITKDVIRVNLYRPDEVSIQEEIPSKMTFEAFTAVYCNTMYVTGVGINKDEIWKYNMASGWVKCGSLVQGRRRHSAAFIDEVLYICGGFVDSNKSVLDSVEAYDAVTNECRTVGKLLYRIRSSGNCVPYRSSLFIFGGSDEDDKEVSRVQVYNTKENTCTLLARPMPHPYMLMRAVLWETSAILVGPNTCYIFNFETEKWVEREKFKIDVVHFGLILDNDRLFVIGGGNYETEADGKTTRICRGDVRSISLQSIIKKKPIEWKIHAMLPKPSFVQACAKIGFTV